MAGAAQKAGPSSVDEALNGVVQAITVAMTTPDAAGPVGQGLMQLLQVTLGLKKMGQGKGPGGGGQQATGAMGPAGGTNIAALMGGAPQGPSGAVSGGAQGGAGSADMARRAVAEQSEAS